MQRFQQIKHALGSEAALTICVEDGRDHEEVFKRLWQYLEVFEDRFSRFREESELSLFNLHAGEQRVVSKEFAELLILAKQYTERTSGLYNPFILPALQQAGYVGSWPTPAVHNEGLNYSSRTVVDGSAIECNKKTARIPAHTALDFGGIGKGYALDKLAELLAHSSVKNFWLSLGGDVICSGFNLEDEPWSIGVSHFFNSSELVATVENAKGSVLSVATSGVTKRRGNNWHHIIDPRTRKPSQSDVVVATVVTPTATTADVYAKCIVIDPQTKPIGDIIGVVQQYKTRPPTIIQKGETIHAQYI